MMSVVKVSNLRKSYGSLVAVDNVSFSIQSRAIFGIVGPNGAGKTTIVECIEGLRSPEDGKISVLGMDPRSARERMFKQVGVQLQEYTMYKRIRAREALKLFASMYKQPLSPEQLLEEFELKERANSYYDQLSGGEKRKLLTALALVGNPELVILDEPTTGLDPHSRYRFWVTLRRFRDNGLTILLTTHNMQEAEEVCDVVCVIDSGRIVAMGTPKDLLQKYGLGTCVTAKVKDLTIDRQIFAKINPTRLELIDDGTVHLYGTGDDFLSRALQILGELGAHDVTSRSANLEDLYFILIGREYKPEGNGV